MRLPSNSLFRLIEASRLARPATRSRAGLRPIRASYDTIVVGLGAMGSAALYHAARSSLKVLGLEQFDIGHPFGSSHGHTRIFRIATDEGEHFMQFAERSSKLWEELEEDSQQKLLHRCGTLYIGTSLDKTPAHSEEKPFEPLSMTVSELNKSFPGILVEDESLPVLFESRGGFLESDKVVQTHVALAKKMQADVQIGERVESWTPDGSGVRVNTNKSTYYTQSLILTSGPWIAELVPQLKRVCCVERQVIGWYESKRPELFVPERLPTFIALTGTGAFSYGIPAHGQKGLKIALYNHLKEAVGPKSVDRSVNDADRSVLSRSLNSLFRPEEHHLKETSVCLFTNTPDEDFIIDKHPIYPQVLVCSPCSGKGFKFSSAIGQMLISIVLDDLDSESAQLLGHFALSRPSLDVMSSFE